MTKYLIAAAIVLACAADVRAQVVCQQIGTFTYCNQGAPQLMIQPLPPLEIHRPPPTYIPLPGRQIIQEYPYAPTYAPGYRR